MKTRSGFVSNSSSSSFILMYIPDDFDFDCHMAHMIEKHSKDKHDYFVSEFKKITKGQVDKFRRDTYDGNGYIVDFLNDFIVFSTSIDVEGYDTIQMIDKKFFQGLDKIEQRTAKINEEFNLRKERKELLRLKTKDLDPFGEEEWDDVENESFRIKRFKK